MLPPLSRAPASELLAPLPEYPLSRAVPGAAGFFAVGRLAGGAGGVAFPRTPSAAGRAGGAGGAGGTALLSTSSRYAEGVHPDADLSNRLASHHPRYTLVLANEVTLWRTAYHSILFELSI